LRHERFVADVNVLEPAVEARRASMASGDDTTASSRRRGSEPGCGSAMGCRDQQIWRECPFAAVNALRMAPGGKGSRGRFFFGRSGLSGDQAIARRKI
jgi:hypothetical protein